MDFYPAPTAAMPALPPVASGAPTLDIIHNLNALVLLKALPDASIDCVVTSPPYNMGTPLNGAELSSKSQKNWGQSQLLLNGYENHDDAMPYPEYVKWQRAILAECMRVVKPAGAIFYNHKWRIQGGLLENRAAVVDGFPVRQIIIWDRLCGLNHNEAFFTPQFEVIYLIVKPGFKVRSESVHGDVWRVPSESNNPHPAPFPVEIPRRCIEAACPPGGIVLDPFMGSGSTAVAAKQMGRHYIGSDLSRQYVLEARRRVAQTFTLSMFDRVEKVAPPRQIDMFAAQPIG